MCLQPIVFEYLQLNVLEVSVVFLCISPTKKGRGMQGDHWALICPQNKNNPAGRAVVSASDWERLYERREYTRGERRTLKVAVINLISKKVAS